MLSISKLYGILNTLRNLKLVVSYLNEFLLLKKGYIINKDFQGCGDVVILRFHSRSDFNELTQKPIWVE